MIYITGDTHGEIERFYDLKNSNGKELTKNDKLIICGDFGFVFFTESNKPVYDKNEADLDYLETLPYEILFVSGNHENFDRLSKYPEQQYYGGRVKRIRKNVFLLMRGEIFTIENKTFFTMGGAYSMDKSLRIHGVSWWPEELPNNEEYHNASINLRKVNNTVDYVITHTAPKTVIYLMKQYPDYHDAELTGFFDWIYHDINFKHWYFGHWHRDEKISPKATACFTSVIELE